MLTTRQVAQRLNRPYPTISLWVRQGRFKNAIFEDTPRGGIWWIPESDVLSFILPKPGRPKGSGKPKAAKKISTKSLRRKTGKGSNDR